MGLVLLFTCIEEGSGAPKSSPDEYPLGGDIKPDSGFSNSIAQKIHKGQTEEVAVLEFEHWSYILHDQGSNP